MVPLEPASYTIKDVLVYSCKFIMFDDIVVDIQNKPAN